jgi:hypothetical protein
MADPLDTPNGAHAPVGQPRPADEALRLATAYQASKALHVAIRMGLPDLLADGSRTAEDLARDTEAHGPSLRRLLRSLSAHGVFSETAEGRFTLGPLGVPLRKDAPGSVQALALMWGDEDYWRTWAELEHCVRTGRTAAEHLFGAVDAFRRYASDARFGAIFNAGMTVLSATTAAAVVSSYDFSRARRVVDVGGGEGRLLAAILQNWPATRGVLLDLPNVVAGAPRLLAAAGVADRCEVVGGDMFAGVPEGGDLYVLSRVIHSFPEERAVTILRACRAAMSADAHLLLVEYVLPDRVEGQAEPSAQAQLLMDLTMLVRTGGRQFTAAEYRAFLQGAGLRVERIIPTAAPVSLVEAAPA